MLAVSETFLSMAGARTSVRSLRHKMALASNPLATNNRGSSARATRAKTVASAKKAGIDLSVTALALDTGHAPVKEVNVCVWMCTFWCNLELIIKLILFPRQKQQNVKTPKDYSGQKEATEGIKQLTGIVRNTQTVSNTGCDIIKEVSVLGLFPPREN